MATWTLPPQVSTWISRLSQPLHGRLAWRLLPLLSGMLFAQGRRTVSSWLCRRPRARLQTILSFSRLRGPVQRVYGQHAAAPAGGPASPARASAVCHRRYADQAGRAVGRRSGHSPQPHARAGRAEVSLRAHLGDHRLDRSTSPLGSDRSAAVRVVVHPAPRIWARSRPGTASISPSAPNWNWPPSWSPGSANGCVSWANRCGSWPTALTPNGRS